MATQVVATTILSYLTGARKSGESTTTSLSLKLQRKRYLLCLREKINILPTGWYMY